MIGTSDDLLDDVITFSTENLQVRRYVTLPNSVLDQQQTRFIISMTTRPGDDNAFYTSSQDGRIHRVAENGGGTGIATEWFNVNDSIAVEQDNTFHGGLRAIAFHPDFNDDTKDGYGKLYGSLVAENGSGSANFIGSSPGSFQSVVAEWTFDFNANQVQSSSYRELFRIRNPQLDHPIKQLAFNSVAAPGDEDYGLLYIGQGDGSILGQFSGTGQETDSALGKILRVAPLENGALPYTTPGNTFALDSDPNTLAEVYSYGHRNPHHLAFGRGTNNEPALIVAEVGQDNIDEVNVIEINTAQGGDENAFNYGWSHREGTFVKIGDISGGPLGRGYGVRPPGGGEGDSALVLPLDDDGLELIYPALQLDPNDPTDGNRYGVAGGQVVNGRYYYSNFAGNGVRPGGEIWSVAVDDLLSQKTSFDASLGEDTTDLTWIDDHVQHRLEFDHDNNPLTSPMVFDDFADLLSFDTSTSLLRSDIRFGLTADGDLLLSSKQNGAVYLVTNNLVEEPGVTFMVDLATGEAVISNQSTEAFEIDGYAVQSTSGSLVTSAWETFESQGIDDGDWVASPALATVLSELQKFGTTTFDDGTAISLGDIYGGTQDLLFSYLLDGFSEPANVVAQYVLAGDYNGDGTVDAADYTVWRDALASGGSLDNDLTPGSVTGDDYLVWRRNFGQSLGGAGLAVTTPEPSGVLMLATGLAGALAPRRRRRDQH